MDSRNPVLSRAGQYAGFHEPGATTAAAAGAGAAGAAATDGMTAEQLQELYSQPAATRGPVVRIDDVIVKTAGIFVLLLVGAAVGWVLPALAFPAMLIGLGLALVNVFKKQVSPVLVMAYALVEGVFVGGFSRIINDWVGQDVVQQAVLGTLVAFGVMLALYRSRIIKVNGRFMKIMTVALISYAVIAIASFVSSFFGVGGGWGFYGVGGLGLLLCAAGVMLASFSLALDFEAINQAIAMGLPERESWRLAFGLMVTLVWLYIEILRFLAILNSGD
jgi:uncharacterized YccA/Bax inhibitor family protein